VLLYGGTAVVALLIAFRGVRVHRPAHRRGWLLLLAGLIGWARTYRCGPTARGSAPGVPLSLIFNLHALVVR
jgi:hypothetical protein